MIKTIVLATACFVIYVNLPAQPGEGGKGYYYYQRYQSAETFFHNQLKQQPADAEAWLWLVRSYLQQDKLKNAKDSLSLAPVSVHENPYYLLAKGSIYLKSNKKDSAQLLFNEAVDITKSKNPVILGLIAEAHADSEAGDGPYAIELLTKALKRDKNSAWLYTVMGNVYRKMLNGGEAYRSYMQAAEKDKNYAEAYYQLGSIFLSQKNTGMYVDFFNKAIVADKDYAPAYRELYRHYLYTNPDASKAMKYFEDYARLSDKTLQHEYSYTDLLYLTKQYADAISNAKKIIAIGNAQPRLYKLIAYSYAETKDTSNALPYMQQYFVAGSDSDFIAKDFETMAELYARQATGIDSANVYYQKAITVSKDSAVIYNYYEKLANLAKTIKDYAAQAKWLGMFYMGNDEAKNVDLFNWGIAAYRASDFIQSDTVFGLYAEKYPTQGFGYYWRAKSNAGIDTAMEKGLAIPYYKKLIEILGTDSLSTTDKKWITEAYSYLAAYEANMEKDYAEAIVYFEKILEIDPANEKAKSYIEILEKSLPKEGNTDQ